MPLLPTSWRASNPTSWFDERMADALTRLPNYLVDFDRGCRVVDPAGVGPPRPEGRDPQRAVTDRLQQAAETLTEPRAKAGGSHHEMAARPEQTAGRGEALQGEDVVVEADARDAELGVGVEEAEDDGVVGPRWLLAEGGAGVVDHYLDPGIGVGGLRVMSSPDLDDGGIDLDRGHV